MEERDQGNTFFPLLTGEEAGAAQDSGKLSEMPELGGVLSPSSMEKADPGGMLPSGTFSWDIWQPHVQSCSQNHNRKLWERLEARVPPPPCKGLLDSWFTCLPSIVLLPPRGS